MLSCAGADRCVERVIADFGMYLTIIQAPNRYAWCMGQALRHRRPCQHWPDHPFHPLQRCKRARYPRGPPPCPLQVPWTPKDHRFEEVGIHKGEQGGLSKAQGGEEGGAVRIFVASSESLVIDCRNCRDGAYVQFIRPKGALEANLRTQLKA